MLDAASGGLAPAWITAAILGYVTCQRLFELWLARRNTQRLLAQGALEVGSRHYPLIVALHSAWLAALWLQAFGRPIDLLPLAFFGLVQGLRFWTLLSLGPRWTTRILVVPGERLVARGPYRYVRHPNYLVVALEIFLLPASFGLTLTAAVFSLLNAVVLAIRIRAEESALRTHTRGKAPPPTSTTMRTTEGHRDRQGPDGDDGSRRTTA